MSFPFTLPTTSTLSFSQHYASKTYPSLLLTCSTHRGILRDSLKDHKRLSPSSQGANIKHIISVTSEYLSYLLFLQNALKCGEATKIPNSPEMEPEWRPTLSSIPRFGVREPPRRKGRGIEYEIFWTYSTLAYAHTIQARALLMEFLSPSIASTDSTSPLLPQATNHLLTSASIFNYMLTLTPPGIGNGEATYKLPVDISESMLSSLASISMASATLLAVLRSDPYPTYLALTSTSNSKKSSDANTKNYLYVPPPAPTGVKAHLNSRLCIAASEHAAKAQGAISSLVKAGEINEDYSRYLDDLRKAAKARGCRFLGVDAEAQGKVGEGLGWVTLAKEILEGSVSSSSHDKREAKEKKSLTSTMEKLRLSKSASPSSSSQQLSAGGLPHHLDPCSVHSELQTVQGLEAKWSKTNDKLVFERIPPTSLLVGKIPSGREIHTIKEYSPPRLGQDVVSQLWNGGLNESAGGDRAASVAGPYAEAQFWRRQGDEGYDSSDEDNAAERAQNKNQDVGRRVYY